VARPRRNGCYACQYPACNIFDDNELDMMNIAPAATVPDRTLDITGEVCPMTFVRTRLALDALGPGQTLLVLLKGDEPVRNVPRTAAEQGHAVLAQETDAAGVTHLLLRRR
jgi:tRNA 2-thiouridine synthesizing protein A